MRDLKRNQRVVWYAVPTTAAPILDEYGNDTLEVETLYLPPVQLRCNVSANVGQEALQVFGPQTNYSRTISIVRKECPLVEGCRVWFRVEPNEQGTNYNYTVVRVADGKNSYLIALREVTPHG